MPDYDRAASLAHHRLLWAERRAWLAMGGCLVCAVATLGIAIYAVHQAGRAPAAVPIYVELTEDGRLLQATPLEKSYGQIPASAIKVRLIEWITRFRRRPADPVLATRDIEWALRLTDEPTTAALADRLMTTRPIDDIRSGLTVDVTPLTAIERQPGHWELTWREIRRERGRQPSTLTYRGLVSIELHTVPVTIDRPFGELITYVDYSPLSMGVNS